MIGAINIIFIQPKLLTPEELGLTRLLYDFAYIIGLAVPLGLPNIIVKFFPFFKDKDEKHNGFAGIILIVFFAGFILSAISLLIFKPSITSHYIDKASLFVEYFSFIIPFTFIVSAIAITTAYCQALFKSTIPSFLCVEQYSAFFSPIVLKHALTLHSTHVLFITSTIPSILWAVQNKGVVSPF